MEQQATLSGGKFSCPACGKQYAWKPQLAGKKAKCACGAMLVIPQAEAAPAGPPVSPPVNPLDDPYDFAPADESAAPPPKPAAAPRVAASPGAALAPAALGYVPTQSRADKYKRTGTPEDALISKPRDVYLPLALTIAGGLAMVAWAMHELGMSARVGIAGVSFYVGFITLIKTGVILGLALLLAPKLDISFGDFPTAVRMLLAVVIVSDACVLWTGTIMAATGAHRPGWISLLEIVIYVVVAAAVISVLCHFLFNMGAEETGMFALPLALISLVLWLVLHVGAMVLIRAADDESEAGPGTVAAAPATTKPAAPDSAPADAPADATAKASPAEGAAEPADAASDAAPAPAPAEEPFGETDADRAILRNIRESRYVAEGRAWAKRPGAPSPEVRMVEALYAAGARKVFVDFNQGRGGRPIKIFAELPPTDPQGRAPVFQAHLAVRRANRLEPAPKAEKDHGQRFLVVDLRK
jgi:hypothetical protein